MDLCLRVLKESNKSRFDSYSVNNSVLIISHITLLDCRAHIFPTTFLEIAAYEEKLAQLGGWPNPQKRDPAEPTLYFYCEQSAKFCNGNVWLAQGTL